MSYEKITSCPVCHSESMQNHIIVVDQLVSNESFVISKCNTCSLLFTNPRPDLDSIGSYYESTEYISHNSSKSGLKSFLYKTARYFTLRQKERLAKSFGGRSTILDYGCGTGEFLRHCLQKGWQIQGIEPNNKARSIADRNTKKTLLDSIETLEENKYSVITLWHVLEHVHQLQETIEKLKKALAKNGRIIIAVPNHNSYDAEYYSDQWAGWDVPRHLYHFNEGSMRALAKERELKIDSILPMKLDSYYVSLLSEQYMGNKPGYVKAFKQGNKSNKLAKINNNYSSLIYIMKSK